MALRLLFLLVLQAGSWAEVSPADLELPSGTSLAAGRRPGGDRTREGVARVWKHGPAGSRPLWPGTSSGVPGRPGTSAWAAAGEAIPGVGGQRASVPFLSPLPLLPKQNSLLVFQFF